MLLLRIGELELALSPDKIHRLGSSPDCEIVLGHSSVAPLHAVLAVRNGRVHIEDHSAGWSFIDGVEVARAILGQGDRITLGNVPVTVMGLPAPVEERSRPWRAPSSLPIRRSKEVSFSDLMAEELHRAPWFTLSAALHLLVIFLLIILISDDRHGGVDAPLLGMNLAAGTMVLAGDDSRHETIDIPDAPEPEAPLDTDPFLEPEPDVEQEMNPLVTGNLPPPELAGVKLPSIRNRIDDILEAGRGLDAGGFKEAVGELRAIGLELVFVFDSTGSMEEVILETRVHIVRMLQVLQALVPDVRVGVVTFRDRGQDEEYVTRSVPLSRDYYRAATFIDQIDADGGGDPPEAIYEGLQAAISQRWQRGARRVIVLVGDAPAHRRSMPALERMVRKFALDGRSQVHTVVTSSLLSGPTTQARRCYQEIARAGRGLNLTFGKDEALLQNLLSLAFGREYLRDIKKVYRMVENRRSEIPAQFSRLATGRDHVALRRELGRFPVDPRLVRALLRRPDLRAVEVLLDVLAAEGARSRTRHAASYALQRMLSLELPPMPPESDDPVSGQDRERLMVLAKARFRG